MNSLTEALRATGNEVPTYDVADAAIALGRRRRRRSALTAAGIGLLVLVLVAVSLTPLLGSRDAGLVGAGPEGPALPDRIGSPGVLTWSVGMAPPGPAGVVFTEPSGFLTGGGLVTVGAADDTYRTLDSAGSIAGRTALLSPDGSRIAFSAGNDIVMADLRTGRRQRTLDSFEGGDRVVPAVWFADGSGLIVLVTSDASDPTRPRNVTELKVMDPPGGFSDLIQGPWSVAPYGFTVAISPDSTLIAFQYSDFITVYNRVAATKTTITLPDDRTVLAGRGAWTPDGRSLAVVHRDTNDYEARRWELRLLDPVTGVERDPSYRPSLAPASVIRLLGWDSRTGDPVVVGIEADRTVDSFGYGGSSLDQLGVRRVGVYELGRSGPRTLLAPTPGITDLDVADSIITAGLTRAGHPPFAVSASALVGAALLAGALAILGIRRWRRRRAGLRG